MKPIVVSLAWAARSGNAVASVRAAVPCRRCRRETGSNVMGWSSLGMAALLPVPAGRGDQSLYKAGFRKPRARAVRLLELRDSIELLWIFRPAGSGDGTTA